jgi:hypothetical protein
MKMVAWGRIVRNVSSVKNLNMIENSVIDVFGHMSKLVGGKFRMVIFCDLYSRRKKFRIKISIKCLKTPFLQILLNSCIQTI